MVGSSGEENSDLSEVTVSCFPGILQVARACAGTLNFENEFMFRGRSRPVFYEDTVEKKRWVAITVSTAISLQKSTSSLELNSEN